MSKDKRTLTELSRDVQGILSHHARTFALPGVDDYDDLVGEGILLLVEEDGFRETGLVGPDLDNYFAHRLRNLFRHRTEQRVSKGRDWRKSKSLYSLGSDDSEFAEIPVPATTPGPEEFMLAEADDDHEIALLQQICDELSKDEQLLLYEILYGYDTITDEQVYIEWGFERKPTRMTPSLAARVLGWKESYTKRMWNALKHKSLSILKSEPVIS